MNKLTKKHLIIIGVCCSIALVFLFALINYTSYKTIDVTLSNSVSSINIYTGNATALDLTAVPAATLETSGTVRLRPGVYSIVPLADDSKITTDPIEVTVDDSTSKITIDPYYSQEYLSVAFPNDITDINKLVTDTYKPLVDDVTVQSTQLQHFGEWGIVVISKKIEPRVGVDFYSVIVKKDAGMWTIVAKPSIIQSYATYPNIPRDIIYQANELTSSSSFSAA